MEIIHRQPAEKSDDDKASWADVEFADADLGDRRLNQRVVRIAKSLAAAPKESIPTACDGLAETLAVYQFLDNDKVTLDKVLAPHRERTHHRMRKDPIVLVAQDTTELDYTGCRNRNRDAGPMNRSPLQRGFYLHPSIAFSPEGVDDPDSRAYRKVSSVFPKASVLGTITIQTTRTKETPARQATVEIRSASVTFGNRHAKRTHRRR